MQELFGSLLAVAPLLKGKVLCNTAGPEKKP
jgi:hypothetical protein